MRKFNKREKTLLILLIPCFILLGAAAYFTFMTEDAATEGEAYDFSGGDTVKAKRTARKEVTDLNIKNPAFDPFLKPGERNWTKICVATNPPGANVTISSGSKSRQKETAPEQTTCFPYVARGEEYEILVTKDGYEEINEKVFIGENEGHAEFDFRLKLLNCEGWIVTNIFGVPGQRMAILNGKMVYKGMKLEDQGKRVRQLARNYLILQDLQNPEKLCRVDLLKKEEENKL